MPAQRESPIGKETQEGFDNQNMNSMADMLESYLSCQRLKRGDIIEGVVVHARPGEVMVDVGAKCEGIVQQHDLEKLSPTEREAIQIGKEIPVYVVNPEDANGNIILSLSRARIAHDWIEAQQLMESQETVECQVAGCNKGGVLVYLKGIRGFVPGSQLAVSRVADQSASTDDERWAELMDETLQLKVIEVDQKRNRLILSERAALRDWRDSQREKLLRELNEGDVVRGRVINLVDFGAFVELGGIDGLVHLSELSWKRVSHPGEVVEVGQELDVYVLKVERERERVALSIKRLQPDPWDTVEERYHEGQLVEGTITHLAKWGAFASIVGDEAIEGLIHISELDEGHVVHPRDVVRPGQTVTLRVVGLEAKQHRLALSLKQVAKGEFADQDWKEALGTRASKIESPLSSALSEALSENTTEDTASPDEYGSNAEIRTTEPID